MKNIKGEVRRLLNRVAELNEENEGLKRESSAIRMIEKNNTEISSSIKKIDDLMSELETYEPISSDDGTFTAYKKRIGKSGVDMDLVLNTGLFNWFVQNHPECLELNLRKAEAVLGVDLSAYAKRDAYDIYTVSTDEDYRYIAALLSDYHDSQLAANKTENTQ